MTLALALAAACSQQDFTRPVTDVFYPTHTNSVRRTTLADAAARTERLARVLAEWNMSRTVSREYHLGVEDLLDVAITSLEEVGKVTRLSRPVLADGTVSLPLAGAVRVAGMTPSDAQAAIRAALDGRFIRNPEVNVSVAEYRSGAVVITGAVNKPGIYYLKHDKRSVLEILAEADGLSGAAGSEILLIRAPDSPAVTATSATGRVPAVVPPGGARLLTDGGSPEAFSPGVIGSSTQRLVSIDLRRLIDAGDLRLNAWVTRGDMITVPPRSKEFVYVLGYVGRPGAFEIDRDNPPTALQAVAFAGGLTSLARAQNSFVLRETEAGQKVIPLDLTRMAHAKAGGELMRAGDTLVVGSSFVARLSEFVRPSVGAGVSYAPIP
jgi:polysaccharide export outer membrane protein